MSDDATIIYANGIPIMVQAADPAPKSEDIPDLVTPDSTSGPAEWGRYHDAVREAARSFDNPGEGEIHNFLRARARNHESVDVPAFHEAVRRQRMADLVDIVDHHMRRDGSLSRGHRMVRVQAPRGYMRRALRNSSADDLAHLHHRLVAIGHHHDHVAKYLSERVAPDMWDQASSTHVTMSDDEFAGLTIYNADDFETEWEEPLTDLVNAVKNIRPVINVYVDTKKESEE